MGGKSVTLAIKKRMGKPQQEQRASSLSLEIFKQMVGERSSELVELNQIISLDLRFYDLHI